MNTIETINNNKVGLLGLDCGVADAAVELLEIKIVGLSRKILSKSRIADVAHKCSYME